jgi:hypothetical protein
MPAAIKTPLPDDYTLFIAVAIGLGLGGLLSLLFGRLALPTKIPFEFTIAGYNTAQLLTSLLLTTVVGAIVFFGYVSVVVKDTAFPAAHPWLFLIETLIVSIIPASVIYVMTDFRDNGVINFWSVSREFLLLATKFGIFHLLFQFSGVYSYFFN